MAKALTASGAALTEVEVGPPTGSGIPVVVAGALNPASMSFADTFVKLAQGSSAFGYTHFQNLDGSFFGIGITSVLVTSGTIAAASVAGRHGGVTMTAAVTLNSVSGAASARSSASAALAHIQVGLGRMFYSASVRSSATLSDATNPYQIFCGFGGSISGGTSQIVAFYTHSSGPNWQFQTSVSGSTTTVDSGVPFLANTNYDIEITVNAAGTTADCKINGTSAPQITTNIPTGSANRVVAATSIRRTVASAATSNFQVFKMVYSAE